MPAVGHISDHCGGVVDPVSLERPLHCDTNVVALSRDGGSPKRLIGTAQTRVDVGGERTNPVEVAIARFIVLTSFDEHVAPIIDKCLEQSIAGVSVETYD